MTCNNRDLLILPSEAFKGKAFIIYFLTYTETVGFGITRTKSAVITVTNSWPINYLNILKWNTTTRTNQQNESNTKPLFNKQKLAEFKGTGVTLQNPILVVS